MNWDWSTAGKLSPEGKPMLKKDDQGHVIYDSRKGDFVVAENVTPEYAWFNGEVTYTLLGDKVNKANGITLINALGGSAADGRSLIWPMKVMRGSQPYDPVNKTWSSRIPPATTTPPTGRTSIGKRPSPPA